MECLQIFFLNRVEDYIEDILAEYLVSFAGKPLHLHTEKCFEALPAAAIEENNEKSLKSCIFFFKSFE